MRLTLAIFFLLSFGETLAYTQPPPPLPPPPPLIYSAPNNIDIKEFVAEDNGFKIAFAGTPKIHKQDVTSGSITTYNVYRQGSNSIITVIDSVTEITLKSEEIIERLKNNLLKEPDSKLIEEKDLKTTNQTVKEFAINYGMRFMKVRIIITKKKIYLISNDVTNWHIIGNPTKKAYEDETIRFFNSFEAL